MFDRVINSSLFSIIIPGNIYLFKVNNRNTRKKCEICSKSTIKTPERCHRRTKFEVQNWAPGSQREYHRIKFIRARMFNLNRITRRSFYISNTFFQLRISAVYFCNELSLRCCLCVLNLHKHHLTETLFIFRFSIFVPMSTSWSLYILSMWSIFHYCFHFHYDQ